MVGKLTTVLAKKEAEAYRSQGLHKEALGLYKNLLSSSPNLGENFKNAIQGQVESIQSEIEDDPTQETQMLSVAEIKSIRKGWGANASEGDILVCAKAFCQVGHYQDALPELVKLLQKDCRMENVVGLFAECLVNLSTPKQLFKAMEPMGKKFTGRLEARCRFFLLLTEEMVNQKQQPYAQALYEYLVKDPVISKNAPQRLDAIAKGIKQLEAGGDVGVAQEELSDKDVTPSTSENADESTVLEPEPPTPNPTLKKRFGWLPFFKKKNSDKEQS